MDRLTNIDSTYLQWFDGNSSLELAISLLALVLSCLLAWFVLGWIGLAYQYKVFSDAQFEVYAWTLSVAGLVVFFETFVGEGSLYSIFTVGVGIAALSALFVYSMLTRWWPLPARAPKRLLLLRVFAQDRRGELLLDEVAYRGRFIGPIMMIGGPDLARSTVDPAKIAHFMRWKFHEDFIGDRRTLERRIVAMDERCDPDDRYRINAFFCFDDMWQEAVERLVKRSDAILLDLRGFTPQRRGTAFEIGLLARMKVIGRTAFLLDAKTDLGAVVKAIGAKTFMSIPASHRIQTEADIDGRALFRALAECAVVPRALAPTSSASEPATRASGAGVAA